jgi:hypothetical protein
VYLFFMPNRIHGDKVFEKVVGVWYAYYISPDSRGRKGKNEVSSP